MNEFEISEKCKNRRYGVAPYAAVCLLAYPLFPFDPVRNVEVFYIEFGAGVEHNSRPHVTGVEEDA